MHFEENGRSYLHIWKAHARGIGFGHISLELDNNCYISFWPENGMKSCQVKNDHCPAKWYRSVEEEIQEHGHPTTTLVYGLNVEAIKSWWTEFLLNKPKYDVREQNCAIVVYRALCVGSNWFEENTSDCTGIKTPDRVLYYVNNGYHKNTRIGCGCSCGHCLSLHPYRCVGLIFFYLYRFYLGLCTCSSSVWQYMKGMIYKDELNQIDQEEINLGSPTVNVTTNRLQIPQTVIELEEFENIGFQESCEEGASSDNFDSKVDAISLNGKGTQPKSPRPESAYKFSRTVTIQTLTDISNSSLKCRSRLNQRDTGSDN